MEERCCPRCGAVMASAEFLGQIAEEVAARPGAAGRLLAAVRGAGAHDVGELMTRMEDEAPGLAAAFACFVGTCRGFRSEARAR